MWEVPSGCGRSSSRRGKSNVETLLHQVPITLFKGKLLQKVRFFIDAASLLSRKSCPTAAKEIRQEMGKGMA
jgi:hypothetical protein